MPDVPDDDWDEGDAFRAQMHVRDPAATIANGCMGIVMVFVLFIVLMNIIGGACWYFGLHC